MGANSKIEWCDHTFNPWIGCAKISPGCDHCYAERETPVRVLRAGGEETWGRDAARVRTSDANWRNPLKWNSRGAREGRRYRVFCASMADVFDNAVPAEWRRDLLKLIASTPNLDWLLLTKRIGNAHRMLDEALEVLSHGLTRWADVPWPNVWIGATIVNQAEADRDIPKLLATPARVRFLSCEPLLGPVNLFRISLGTSGVEWNENAPANLRHVKTLKYILNALTGAPKTGIPRIDWVIAGGESGHSARPMHPQWARDLRDQCAAANVPFLFKQWGEFLPADADEADPSVADVPDSQLFWSDGSKWDRFDGQRGGVSLVARVGKKAAGRLLDGREWNEFPRAGIPA